MGGSGFANTFLLAVSPPNELVTISETEYEPAEAKQTVTDGEEAVDGVPPGNCQK